MAYGGRTPGGYGGPGPDVDPWRALDTLREGNVRFATGRSRGCTHSPQERASLAGGQSPLAVVLACSDSRVAPELVFDSTLGELFVVRLAGHAPGRLALASVLFAVEQLAVPLVVVLGHQGCVAVEKALSAAAGAAGESLTAPLIEIIRPSLEPLLEQEEDPASEQGVAGSLLERAVQLNVHACLEVLRSQGPIGTRLTQGALGLHGGVYRLDTGLVEWF